MIETVSFADLGYRRLAPAGEFSSTTIGKLAEYARIHAGYEVESELGARWVRHRERKSGQISSLITEVVVVEHATPDYSLALEPIDRIDQAWEGVEGRFVTPLKDCIGLCDSAETEPPHRALHFLAAAASLAPRKNMRHVISKYVLPRFFSLFPNGIFAVFKVDYAIEKRLAFCRVLHRYSLSAPPAFSEDDSTPLQELHSNSSFEQPALLVDLLSALTYPWVSVVPAVRAGLLFVFVLDPVSEHIAKPFPGSWSEKLRSNAEFAKADVDLRKILGAGNEDHKEAARHRRYRLTARPTAAQTLSLLRYSISRYSRTLWHLTDPAEYCQPGSDTVSPLAPFEFGLTFDRVMRKGVLSVFGSAEIDRKDDCFEVADLIEELWSQRNAKPASAAIFRKLFNRADATSLLASCVADAPHREWVPLLPAVRSAYDALVDGIRSSVVIRSKVANDGIIVRDKSLSKESVEPLEVFVANVVRALRNAHHGYLTANDQANRPARYLSLVDGSFPGDVSLLTAFWAWCAVTDPEHLLERPWMSVGGYIA